MSEDKHTGFKLPDRLITSVDLNHVIRELKLLDDWLNQAAIRSGGKEVKPPKTTATLDEVAAKNGVSLLDNAQREQLIDLLEAFNKSAPRIHLAFAVEPSGNFLSKIIVWMRLNINPVILIEVGLQPALAAGCSVRTTNKYFDMSLRNRFDDSRSFLVKSIQEIAGNDSSPATMVTKPAEIAPAPSAPEPEKPQSAKTPAPENLQPASPAPAKEPNSAPEPAPVEVKSA